MSFKNLSQKDKKSIFFLEAGINHFGSLKEANKIVNFFLKSSFSNLTFMLHSKNFYKIYKKKNLNFILPEKFYKKLLIKAHKRKKKVGLAVCDKDTFKDLKHLNFDFYKLLSVSINNKGLINELCKKNKPIFISTGFNVKNNQIFTCLKYFKKKRGLSILHTPMSYKISELNFKRILELKRKFKIPVGYSNHNNNFNTLNLLSSYKPSSIFLYCKPSEVKGRKYPDDNHAIFLDKLENIKKDYFNFNNIHQSDKKIIKVDIFKNGIKK